MLGVEVHLGRQVDRQIFRRQRADAAGRLAVGVQFVQDRERLAPEMLPAEEPVAELVVDRRAAEPLVGQIFGDLLLELGRGQAVVRAGVDRRAVGDEALPAGQHRRRGRRPASSPGSTTAMIGRSNCWANSKSRVSWAGTAMIAPVP